MLLFVYGTLKKGGINHHWLDGAQFIGKATTVGLYRMIKITDDIPAVIREPKHRIYGEVYEVGSNGLEDVDLLEGSPSYYQRQRTAVKIKNGAEVTVDMYILNPILDTHQLPTVENGYWPV